MKPLTFPLGDFGRFGNSLHQLAATVGIARTLERPVQFSPDWAYLPFLSIPEEWLGSGPAQDVRRLVSGSHWRRTYLQDPALWVHVAGEIRAAFAPSPRAVAVLDAIPPPAPMDVAVHVRRTDYLDMPDHLPTQPAQFYRSASWALARIIGEPTPAALRFHVFGDDPEWALAELPEGWETRRYGSDGDEPTDWCDLMVMARYRHHIIANSSYSFWSAYLSGDDHVCYPTGWYGPKIDVPHPCPSHWIGVTGDGIAA